ncbi:MAG: rod shape-determining protein [Actinomycetota bacterium]|nr:rod shape-determining protein [Actinomycetota bacterium]
MGAALAVDVGSSRTRVMTMSKALLVDEPSLAAVEIGSGRLIAFGERARAMRGRTAGEVALVRPVRHGQLQDLALTDQVCVDLLRRARVAGHARPDVLCCVPSAATSVQRRALERSFRRAGARRVEFLEHAVASGMGALLRLEEPVASMVVDVGGGTTDIAVIALGGVVTGASVPVGGGDFDEAIRQLCERSFDLVIDTGTAEAVKLAIGTAWPSLEDKVEVRGRDASNGEPRAVVLSRGEVATALAEQVDAVVRAAVGCITTSPPDLANDLLARGLHLAGSGGLLDGFSQRLATATGIPVHLVDEPGLAAVRGASRCLKVLAEL